MGGVQVQTRPETPQPTRRSSHVYPNCCSYQSARRRVALEFYQSVFGGHLVPVTYQDAHNVQNPDEANQIMWGQVASEDGFHVMAYDVPSATAYDPGEIAYFVSVRGKTTDEITGYWNSLSAHGTIKAPLAPAGFSPLYGMVTDQFGVTWVLDVAVEYNPTTSVVRAGTLMTKPKHPTGQPDGSGTGRRNRSASPTVPASSSQHPATAKFGFPICHTETRPKWRAWLEDNHDSTSGVWLCSWRPTSERPRCPYPEVVEEAICFGWIDSTVTILDATRGLQLLTPRKPKSS